MMRKHLFCGYCGHAMVAATSTSWHGYDRQTGEAKLKRRNVTVCGYPFTERTVSGFWEGYQNEAHDGWYRLHEVRPVIEVPG